MKVLRPPPGLSLRPSILASLRSNSVLDFENVEGYFMEFMRLAGLFQDNGGLASDLGPDGFTLILIRGVPWRDGTWWSAREELECLYEDLPTRVSGLSGRLTYRIILDVLTKHEKEQPTEEYVRLP